MTRPRRSLLHAGATVCLVGLAGCSSLQVDAQYLVIENETDASREVTVVVNEPRSADTGATETTTPAGTTATDTGERFIVDFEFAVEANDRRELNDLFPIGGTYEVVASVPDVGTGRTEYTDTESTRITITSSTVQVSTFTGTPAIEPQ